MPQDYSAAAARKIVGITQRCLDYWDQRGIVSPSVKRAMGKGSERRYSYQDLVRLSVVKRLRANGLSLQKIQQGLRRLRRTAAADPLLDEVLVTDGHSFQRLTKNRAVAEDVLANGQLVFSVVAVGRIDQELREQIVRLEGRIKRRGRSVSQLRQTGGEAATRRAATGD
jgi:DNA-binding transcriptional MerR regulator